MNPGALNTPATRYPELQAEVKAALAQGQATPDQLARVWDALAQTETALNLCEGLMHPGAPPYMAPDLEPDAYVRVSAVAFSKMMAELAQLRAERSRPATLSDAVRTDGGEQPARLTGGAS